MGVRLVFSLFLLRALERDTTEQMQNQEILELANLRIDGRQFDQIRKLKHNIGLIPKADGSAYLEHGLNKVLVILNGPQEIRKKSDGNDEKCIITTKVLFAPFSSGRERKVRKPVSDKLKKKLSVTVNDSMLVYRVIVASLKWNII